MTITVFTLPDEQTAAEDYIAAHPSCLPIYGFDRIVVREDEDIETFGDYALGGTYWAVLNAIDPARFGPNRIIYVQNHGIGGSHWFSDGSRWRAVNGEATLYNLAEPVAHDGTTTPAKLAECTIPAGMVKNGDIIEVHWVVDASAVGDTATVNLRLGHTGLVGNQSIALAQEPAGGTNRFAAGVKCFKRIDATTIIALDGDGATGIGGSGVLPVPTDTVDDMDADASKLTLWVAEATGGVRVCTLRHLLVKVITCGA